MIEAEGLSGYAFLKALDIYDGEPIANPKLAWVEEPLWDQGMCSCVDIEADNWAVLYVNGEKWEEFHSIPLGEFARVCREVGPIVGIVEAFATEAGERWLAEGNYFPEQLSDLDPTLYYVAEV